MIRDELFLTNCGRTIFIQIAHQISLVPPLIPLVIPSSPSRSPLIRCSRRGRLANKAELTGGRKVYSRDDRRLKPLFPL
jgi:hypothetical protein